MKEEFSAGIIPLTSRGGEWQVFLIHQLHGNFWGFPKGHIEGVEAPLEAAKRELKEETGLSILSLLPLSPFRESYEFNQKGEEIRKHLILFAAVTTEEAKIDPSEVIEGRWLPLKEAEKQITYPQLKKILNELIRAVI